MQRTQRLSVNNFANCPQCGGQADETQIRHSICENRRKLRIKNFGPFTRFGAPRDEVGPHDTFFGHSECNKETNAVLGGEVRFYWGIWRLGRIGRETENVRIYLDWLDWMETSNNRNSRLPKFRPSLALPSPIWRSSGRCRSHRLVA